MAKIDIVDENDNVIKTIDFKDKKITDIHRSAVVMIFNDKNEILLQKRAKHDFKFPGHWDISGSGTVDTGEDYLTAAKRETFEELGVQVEDLDFIDKYFFDPKDGRHYFSSLYKAFHNGPFKIDPNELDSIEFFSIELLREMLNNPNEKFHPECRFALQKYFL